MKHFFLLLLISLLNTSLHAQKIKNAFLNRGQIVFEASPDLDRKYAMQSDMQEIMLLDLSIDKTLRLTEDQSKDVNPTFFKNDLVLFESKRPCKSGLAENCPSQLYTISTVDRTITKFEPNLSKALQKIKQQAQNDSLFKKLNDLGIKFDNPEEYSLENPSYNAEKNYISFVYSTPKSYLVVYDLDSEYAIHVESISGLASNFDWSPDGSLLAYSEPIMDGMLPTGNTYKILDIEYLEESTLNLSDNKFRLESWSLDGYHILFTKQTKNNNGDRLNNAYSFELASKKIHQINKLELPEIIDWIKIISDNCYLVQKVDKNNTLDLWIIDSSGADLKRLTTDGHLKFVQDTRIN